MWCELNSEAVQLKLNTGQLTMTPASKSDPVVDDFLKSLSQLSQERLREDQQRQRDLQRNIDVLRLKLGGTFPVKRGSQSAASSSSSSYSDLGISLLKFNRSINSQNILRSETSDKSDDESVPALPRRRDESEVAPKYPARPNSIGYKSKPPLPTRRDILGKKLPPSKPIKSLLLKEDTSFDVELMQPVARKHNYTEKKSNLPSESSSNYSGGIYYDDNKVGKKQKSFFDLEKDIKTSAISATFDSRLSVLHDKVDHQDDNRDTPTRPKLTPKLESLAKSTSSIPGLTPKPKNPPPDVLPKPKTIDWLTSLNNSSSAMSTPQPHTPKKPSYLQSRVDSTTQDMNSVSKSSNNDSPAQSNKKPTTWIDSAIKKSDSHNKFDDLKPSYQIPKRSSEHQINNIEEEPELLVKFKNKSAPALPPKIPLKLSKNGDRPEQINEYLTKLKFINTGSSFNTPLKPKKYSSTADIELKSPTKDIKINKPKSEYQEKDTEELRKQLSKLSTSPSKITRPSIKKYEAQDTEELKSQLHKLGSKKVGGTNNYKEEVKPEGLVALGKLKPTKPKKLETLKKEETKVRDKKDVIKVDDKKPDEKDQIQKKNISELDFKSQLSSILKPGSAVITPRNSELDRKMRIQYSEAGSESKLTHYNKSRAKGPKRRLPKSKTKADTSAREDAIAETARNTGSSVSRSRKPYINKQSKPRPEVPIKPRVFSGEVFI